MQLEIDFLDKAALILKKEKEISLDILSNKENVVLIDDLSPQYSIKELLLYLNMARSSYFYHKKKALLGDKYADLRGKIKDIFDLNYQSYGYRRIYGELKSEGITVSEKVIRRLMQEEGLNVISVKKKKHSSYKGEISPEVDNIINCDFHSDRPKEKLLTDITELSIPQGKYICHR